MWCGKAEVLKNGEDVSIIAIGKMVEKAIEVGKLLEQKNKSAQIINARFLKPLDEKTIIQSIQKTKFVVTIEDGLLKGGLGSAVTECIIKNCFSNVKIKTFGYDDTFVPHGKIEEIEEKYHLDVKSIFDTIQKELKR